MAAKQVVRRDVVEISFDVNDTPLEKVTRDADRMKRSVGSATDSVTMGLQRMLGPTGTVATALRRMGEEGEASAVKLSKIGDSLDKAGTKLNDWGSSLTMKLTVPLTAAATAATRLYSDAETGFAKVGTIADGAVLSYEKVKSQVTQASRETGVAVTDLSEALYQSLSAGVDSGQAISFTTDMVKLAKGGFTSTEKAVDVVTSALNAYGMGAEQAMSVSDKLVTTQNVGKTTVDQLASSLGRVIPTAKAFNVGIDDTCAAIADLTKNGIKTEEATTYLNSMLNELGANGTNADKALRQMTGQGFADLIQSGTSVTQVLGLLQENADESGLKLSDMFGSQEGAKAALTIMKDGGLEYNEILKQMAGSSGATQAAFEQMDATPAARFQKELNKLQLAGMDAGEKLLPFFTKAAELVGSLADRFSSLSDKQQGDILGLGAMAAAAGPALKIVGSITKGVGGVSKALGNSGLMKIVLGLPGPIKAIGIAAGIAGIAFKAMQKAAIDDSLNKHFGDVKLSMEECADVAKRLTTNEWTMKLEGVVEARAELEQMKQDLESSVKEINKIGWKVSIGLKLSEEELGGFQNSVEDYISESVGFVQQKQYTVSLALDATLTPGSEAYNNLTTFAKTFFEKTNTEMTRLGGELAQMTNDALSDGLLSSEEYAAIDAKKKEMMDYVDKMSEDRFGANLTKIQMRAPKQGLDVESFSEISRLTTENIQKQMDNADISLTETIGALRLEYPEGGVDYERLLQGIKLDDAGRRGSYVLDGLNLELGTLQTNFKEPLGKFETEFGKEMNTIRQNLLDNPAMKMDTLGQDMNMLIAKSAGQLSWGDLGATKKMVELLQPKMGELEQVAQTYYEAGKLPPAGITKGLAEGYRLEAATGAISAEHMWDLLASEISNSPGQQAAVLQAMKAGEQMPMELANSLSSNYGLIYSATKGQFVQINSAAVSGQSEVQGLLSSIGVDVGTKAGTELVNSLMSQEPAVRMQAITLFSQMQTAADDQKAVMAESLSGMGVQLSDELMTSMSNTVGADGKLASAAQGKAGEAVEKMNSTTSGTTLTGPNMGNVRGAGDAASSAHSFMQGYFNNNPIIAYVTRVETGGVAKAAPAKNAAGGFIHSKTLSWLAEEGHPEVVIPLAPARRARALGLLGETAQRLGVSDRAVGGVGSIAKPEVAHTGEMTAVRGSGGSYVDNSRYNPQFIASFGSATATDRELEKKVRAWVFSALEDFVAGAARQNPAVLEV